MKPLRKEEDPSHRKVMRRIFLFCISIDDKVFHRTPARRFFAEGICPFFGKEGKIGQTFRLSLSVQRRQETPTAWREHR